MLNKITSHKEVFHVFQLILTKWTVPINVDPHTRKVFSSRKFTFDKSPYKKLDFRHRIKFLDGIQEFGPNSQSKILWQNALLLIHLQIQIDIYIYIDTRRWRYIVTSTFLIYYYININQIDISFHTFIMKDLFNKRYVQRFTR